ncbi:MAG: hypothetical protein WAL22_01105 [Solirubrobacteraceae bacterium]
MILSDEPARFDEVGLGRIDVWVAEAAFPAAVVVGRPLGSGSNSGWSIFTA